MPISQEAPLTGWVAELWMALTRPPSPQTPFHLQLDWASPLETVLDVLVSLLQAHAWEDIALVLCRVRDPTGLVTLWTSRAGQPPKFVLDLAQLDRGNDSLRAGLALLGALEGREGPGPAAVLLGCSAARAQEVLEAAPPGTQWLLGTPLSAEALPTAGLPPGVLALGETERPSLEAAIHDVVELVAQALSSMALVHPEHALLQAGVNCEALKAIGSKSPGRTLAG